MPASYSLSPDVQHGVATCSGAFGCLEAVGGSLVALLLWAGLSTGLLFAPRTNVRAALAALEQESETIIAEQEALSLFSQEVESVPTASPTASVGGGGVGVIGTTNSQPQEMATLRQAYRDTVMAVDHFERDYGESLSEHLAEEFGDGVARAVLTNERLSPQIKQAVLASAGESRTQREQYLKTLESERDRLRSAGEKLDDAVEICASVDGNRLRRRSFEELQSRYERLETERSELSATLSEHQDRLHEGKTFGWQREDSESVHSFLYRDIDTTYPVLADGIRVLTRMSTVERRLTTALTARV